MDQEKISALLDKYKAGLCSPEEEQVLKYWLHQYNMDGPSGLSDEEFSAAESEMLQHINAARSVPVRRLWTGARIAAAAAMVGIILSTGLYFYLQKTNDTASRLTNSTEVIRPGKQGATLTLSNGRKIRLADAGQGLFAKETGVEISKNEAGEVIYRITGNANSSQINTLSTARGETFQIRLPDGTRVWLNAASSLTYPASFTGLQARRLKLQGEGYFEVAKDKQHPFIVESNGQEVTVLGTHFNIDAYGDEPRLTTTLLEGKVNVTKNGRSAILSPGQQSEVSKDNASGIRLINDANIDEAVAWKDNKFVFAGEDIRSVMRKLSRWYDIEPVFAAGVTTVPFGGSISRNKELKDVLNVLELTKAVHFKVEGRRIIIMP